MNLIKKTHLHCLAPFPPRKHASVPSVPDAGALKDRPALAQRETNMYTAPLLFLQQNTARWRGITATPRLAHTCVSGHCVLMTRTVVIFDLPLCAQTQTDWLIWSRPLWSRPVPGLTLLTSPRTTYFIFTKSLSSPHAVIGLLMREHWCEDHPSDWNYTARPPCFS